MAGHDFETAFAREQRARPQTVLIAQPEGPSAQELAARLETLGFTVLLVSDRRDLHQAITSRVADLGVVCSTLIDLPGLLKEEPGTSWVADRSHGGVAMPLLITVDDPAAFDWDTYASLEGVDYVLLPTSVDTVLRRVQTSALRLTRRAFAHHKAEALRRGVREMLAEIRALQDPVAMIECLLPRMATVFGEHSVCYWTFDDKRMVPVRMEWRADARGPRPLGEAPNVFAMRGLASALWGGQTVRTFEDSHQGTTDDGGLSGWARTRDTQASLALPVGLGDSAFGLLWMASSNAPREWSTLEISLLQHLMSNVAQALVQAQIIIEQKEMVERLRRVDNAKNEFLTTVNHELRTPLTSLTAYVQMIQDGAGGVLPPAARSMVQVVGRNAKRLEQLVDDVVTVSRLSANDRGVQSVPVNLRKILVDVLGTLGPAATLRGVTLCLDDGAEDVVVDGEPALLRQVFRNLVDNAVKFTPAGGKVDVFLTTVEAGEGMCAVSVRDTGVGIPDHELADLFTTFVRGEQAQMDAVAGSGLGLAVVRGIVDAHHGTVTMSCPDGGGTTVAVRLPVKGSQRADTDAPDSDSTVTVRVSPAA